MVRCNLLTVDKRDQLRGECERLVGVYILERSDVKRNLPLSLDDSQCEAAIDAEVDIAVVGEDEKLIRSATREFEPDPLSAFASVVGHVDGKRLYRTLS